MKRRTERVSDLLREQLDYLLRREAKDPRLGSIWSITDVDVTGDLRHAKVHVSVLGSDEEAASTLQGMTAARGYLRRELSHRLNTMHHIPELTFQRDASIERAARLAALMDDLAREREERVAALAHDSPAATDAPDSPDALADSTRTPRSSDG